MDSQSTVDANEGQPDFSAEKGKFVFPQGMLHVQIFRARGIRGDEMIGWGKADPYLKVTYGNLTNSITLRSTTHPDAGSNPVWNYQFSFPLRNGGGEEHNIVEIEICDENKHTGFIREENSLGHLRQKSTKACSLNFHSSPRIGGLAGYICRHPQCITKAAWYPVFYRRKRSSTNETGVERGEILMKFYFQHVDQLTFVGGQHTEPIALRLPSGAKNGNYERVEDTLGRVGSFVGRAVVEVAGTVAVIMLL